MGIFTIDLDYSPAPIQHGPDWTQPASYWQLTTIGSTLGETITFAFTGDNWSLDGGPHIPFASLPAGFTPLTATFIGDMNIQAVGAGGSGFAHVIVTAGGFTFPEDTITGVIPGNLSALDLNLNNIIIEGLVAFDPFFGPGLVVVQAQAPSIASIRIEGTYAIAQSNSQVNPVIQNPTVPVRIGDKVKIDSDIKGLDGVEQVQISYTDADGLHTLILDPWFIIIQDPEQFWFYLPYDLGSFAGQITITLVGNGVQFSGSVVAGTLNVLFADASGIYTLVKGQTNDILYFRDGYTTDIQQLTLNFLDESSEFEADNFFEMLRYPYKILSQVDLDEDYQTEDDFAQIAILRIVTVPLSVEIPSPFIKTGFLP